MDVTYQDLEVLYKMLHQQQVEIRELMVQLARAQVPAAGPKCDECGGIENHFSQCSMVNNGKVSEAPKPAKIS